MTKKKTQVAILMSIYNGEKFLEEQIRSISDQLVSEDVQIGLYVRNDGSSDKSLSVVKKLQGEFQDLITVIDEPAGNVGVKKSFFSLLTSPLIRADYYFLSDQDDIWDKHKVSDFLKAFSGLPTDKVIGVYSDLWIADKNANSTDKKMSQIAHWKDDLVDFRFLTFDYRVTGCAFAINDIARSQFTRLVSEEMIESVNMHDSLLALLIAATGQLYQLDKPTVYYRQHGGNVIGAIKKRESIVEKINKAIAVPGQLVHDNVCVGNIISDNVLINSGVLSIISLYKDYDNANNLISRLHSASKIYPLMHHRRRWLHFILMTFIHTTEFTTQPWIGNK